MDEMMLDLIQEAEQGYRVAPAADEHQQQADACSRAGLGGMAAAESAAAAGGFGTRNRWMAALVETASRVSGAVASAQELLRDRELRRKGAAFIVNRAQEGLSAIGKQISLGVFVNRQQVAALLSRIEGQISEYQRDKQIKETRRQNVDVQVGPDVYVGVPQEVRYRLWMALLEDLSLAEPFRPIQCRNLMAPPSISSPVSMEAVEAAAAAASCVNPIMMHPLPHADVPASLLELLSASAVAAGNTAVAPASALRENSGGPRATGWSEQPDSALAARGSVPADPMDASSRPAAPDNLPDVDGFLQAASVDSVVGWSGGDSPGGASVVVATATAAGCSVGAPPGAASPTRLDSSGGGGNDDSDFFSGLGQLAGARGGVEADQEGASSSSACGAERNADGASMWAESASGAGAEATPRSEHPQAASHLSAATPGIDVGPSAGPSLDSDGSSGLRRSATANLALSRSPSVPPAAGPTLAYALGRTSAGSDSALQARAAAGASGSMLQLTRMSGDTARGGSGGYSSEEPSGGGMPIDEWEVLPEGGSATINGAAAGASGRVQQLLRRVLSGSEAGTSKGASGGEGGCGAVPGVVGRELSAREHAARARLVQAMLDVAWSSEEGGTPPPYSEDSRFAILNDMTAGQEEIDDIIKRDMHRTFPEHPMFGSEAGQDALFRVLKAYSLHDLEVGYCQGMAFAAGILLMYLPEEPTFRLFCRLMDPEGPNLRRMYMPTLDALKLELARFEVLLLQLHPRLYRHIMHHGVPSVLYVSQWLMTVFATPFPSHFSARVIDVMLQDGNDRLMMRIAMAVMQQLEDVLLEQDDFELLVTQLKVTPARWGLTMLRKIMDAALTSSVSDEQLDAAGVVAAHELVTSPRRPPGGGNSASLRGQKLSGASSAAEPVTAGQSTRGACAATDSLEILSGEDGCLIVGASHGGGDEDAARINSASSQQAPDSNSNLNGDADVDGMLGLDEPGELGGSYSGLEIDDEYMKMIMELDLLSPWEKGRLAAEAGDSQQQQQQ